jgi:flavodoxin
MNSLVIYDSVYGNTQKIAEAIADVFEHYGPVRMIPASNANPSHLQGIGLLAIGGPTQAHGASPAIKELLEILSPAQLAELSIVAFDTRIPIFRWLSGSAAESIEGKVQYYNAELIQPPESFFVEGRGGPLKEGEVERAVEWARMIMETVLGQVRIDTTEVAAAR